MIAEKPDAMKKIAESLSEGYLKKVSTRQGPSYYEFFRNNTRHIIVAAVGHLFNLAPIRKGSWAYPVFDAIWKPSYEIRKESFFSFTTKKSKRIKYLNISHLMRVIQRKLVFRCKQKHKSQHNKLYHLIIKIS